MVVLTTCLNLSPQYMLIGYLESGKVCLCSVKHVTSPASVSRASAVKGMQVNVGCVLCRCLWVRPVASDYETLQSLLRGVAGRVSPQYWDRENSRYKENNNKNQYCIKKLLALPDEKIQYPGDKK